MSISSYILVKYSVLVLFKSQMHWYFINIIYSYAACSENGLVTSRGRHVYVVVILFCCSVVVQVKDTFTISCVFIRTSGGGGGGGNQQP